MGENESGLISSELDKNAKVLDHAENQNNDGQIKFGDGDLNREKQERIFRIKHDDFCLIVFKNGGIISIAPSQLYDAIQNHRKSIIEENAHRIVPHTFQSSQGIGV